MAKRSYKFTASSGKLKTSSRRSGRWMALVVTLLAIGGVVFAFTRKSPSASPPLPSGSTGTNRDVPTMEVNQAVMVTVELDFGSTLPTVAEALREIERRHQPDTGTGRTFAVLDAYGEPTPDGKKLHMSMHVSSEKPGIGSLVFKRTGAVLWSSRIVPSTNASSTFSGNALTIYVGNDTGRLWTVDGSSNPASVLEASIKEVGQPLRELWPEDNEREITFIYSACGCPVKVMCRREGERTVRTKDLPVIFPDDPAAVSLISRLMRW